MKKYIEVRQYLTGQSKHGSASIGKITGDYGNYAIIARICRKVRAEQIGNFNPLFCTYNGNKRCLIHSEAGDISDSFRRDESYLKTLFIEV